MASAGMASSASDPRDAAISEYRSKLLQHRELDARVRTLRDQVRTSRQEYDKTEDDLKALQSVGQIIGEVLRQLDPERCERGRPRGVGPGPLGAPSGPPEDLRTSLSCHQDPRQSAQPQPPIFVTWAIHHFCSPDPLRLLQSSSRPAAALGMWLAAGQRWIEPSCCPTHAWPWTSRP